MYPRTNRQALFVMIALLSMAAAPVFGAKPDGNATSAANGRAFQLRPNHCCSRIPGSRATRARYSKSGQILSRNRRISVS